MSSVDDAVRTQIANLERRSGHSLDELVAMVKASGLEKHGQIVAWLKSEHGMGHGDANLVAITALRGSVVDQPADELVDAMYAGAKAPLRPFHDQVIAAATALGDDVELAPKQAYVSLRRTKQFGTVGPASGGRLEIGFNLKGVAPTGRLEATTGMCTHRVRLSDPADFDDEVRGWLREAYDRA
jgi:hypothetical protein